MLVAALLTATVLPRLGVPTTWMPDLVLIGVVSTAVLRGPLHGALVGLLAGWVTLLIPPVDSPMGLTAMVMMAGGALAGTFARPSSRSLLRPLAALVVGATVVLALRLAAAVVADGPLEVLPSLQTLATTTMVGVLVLPALLSLDRTLVRRRLG